MFVNRLTEWPRHVGYEKGARKGFFTDTSICIGCKACEVACKEWNRNPVEEYRLTGKSYDNTGALGADTWRHVAFIEQTTPRIDAARASGRALIDLGMPGMPQTATTGNAAGAATSASEAAANARAAAGAADGAAPTQNAAGGAPTDAVGALAAGQLGAATPGADMSGTRHNPGPRSGSPLAAAAAGNLGPDGGVDTTPPDTPDFRWLMSSDVCKHCTNAGCLDVCPTGALFRTEFGTVVVQDDVCNGCGTCVAGCPFGVIERRTDGGVNVRAERGGADFTPGQQAAAKNVGVAQKCTLCYDRLKEGETPACAKACPTTSIQFGDHDEMLRRAKARVAELHAQGLTEARLYGANPEDGVGGTGSIFLLLDEPEVYGLPPDPRVPTADLPQMAATALKAAAGMVGAMALAFVMGGRK
ncbi:4Fe-4S dicluster domain-containing protein [Corynebacterium frankenforstense]|uniref:4Fe-4S dicluster domain-containing protein n=2 Tax=Corynebacterium TaxID=1716 RepID=UPI00254AE5CC|nr:4Fe-4S dicluster domain-containing protein [Corynebacterium frankenforstense]MDK6258932.1 4Fe-4S dicluster domain-containing protein [Corynebacterium frankenforstense]